MISDIKNALRYLTGVFIGSAMTAGIIYGGTKSLPLAEGIALTVCLMASVVIVILWFINVCGWLANHWGDDDNG